MTTNMAAAAMVAHPARGTILGLGCRATPAPLRRTLGAWTKAARAGCTAIPNATRYNPAVTRAAHNAAAANNNPAHAAAAAAANTPTHAAANTPTHAPANTTYIRELRIRDFALVEEQRVSLHPGLNVITGQSGSGKSVLLEAISQLCGRARRTSQTARHVISSNAP